MQMLFDNVTSTVVSDRRVEGWAAHRRIRPKDCREWSRYPGYRSVYMLPTYITVANQGIDRELGHSDKQIARSWVLSDSSRHSDSMYPIRACSVPLQQTTCHRHNSHSTSPQTPRLCQWTRNTEASMLAAFSKTARLKLRRQVTVQGQR